LEFLFSYNHQLIIFPKRIKYDIINLDGDEMEVRELTEEQFEEFVLNSKISSIYQSTEYAKVMSNQGYKILYYGIFSDDEIKGATLLLIEKLHGFKYALAPRGFLIDYEDKEILQSFTTLLRKKLSKKHIMAVKITANLKGISLLCCCPTLNGSHRRQRHQRSRSKHRNTPLLLLRRRHRMEGMDLGL